MKKKKETKFSVALGLFDYINPIFYSITTLAVIIGLKGIMKPFPYTIYIIGAIISLVFGLTIPTVKLLVGLGKFKFKMPVNLVFYVNSGILLSSLAILKHTFNISLSLIFATFGMIFLLLTTIYMTSKKFNTVAVLTGAIGYVMIYTSFITLAIRSHILLPIYLYALAIIFFLGLCLIGIKANLKDAKIHWIIETCNVLCQGLVALATVLLLWR